MPDQKEELLEEQAVAEAKTDTGTAADAEVLVKPETIEQEQTDILVDEAVELPEEAAVKVDQGTDANQSELVERLEQFSLLLHTNYEKTDQIANDLIALSQLSQQTAVAVGELSISTQKVACELEESGEQLRASRLTNIISPIFLLASLVVLAILLVSTCILAIHHKRLQQRLDDVSRMAIEAVELQNQKMAAFDASFEEQLGNQIKTVRDTVGKDSSRSKLNRLRQGNQEQKLIRNSNGDWLLAGNKQELITDQETIDALNTAFERAGRSLVPPKGMPPHSVLCYLTVDGRGGTELMVTKDPLPASQPEKAEKPVAKKSK